jgi:hypothetical protein
MPGRRKLEGLAVIVKAESNCGVIGPQVAPSAQPSSAASVPCSAIMARQRTKSATKAG